MGLYAAAVNSETEDAILSLVMSPGHTGHQRYFAPSMTQSVRHAHNTFGLAPIVGRVFTSDTTPIAEAVSRSVGRGQQALNPSVQ